MRIGSENLLPNDLGLKNINMNMNELSKGINVNSIYQNPLLSSDTI